MKDLIFFFLFSFIVIVSYSVYLNYGCEMIGVMTWEGKVCFEDLPTTPPNVNVTSEFN